MSKRSYVPALRRRREGKTDYRVRKKVIISKQNFIAIRISNKNVIVQIAQPKIEGDHIIASAHSRELRKLGWKGSGRSIPAAYLTGFMAGQRASKVGVKGAIVYSGVKPFGSGSRVAAAVKGTIDGGVNVPVDKEALPPEERLRGEHISNYASSLEGSEETALFSTWRKSISSAESFAQHVDEILSKVKGSR